MLLNSELVNNEIKKEINLFHLKEINLFLSKQIKMRTQQPKIYWTQQKYSFEENS